MVLALKGVTLQRAKKICGSVISLQHSGSHGGSGFLRQVHFSNKNVVVRFLQSCFPVLGAVLLPPCCLCCQDARKTHFGFCPLSE